MRASTYLKVGALLAKHWLSLSVSFSALVGWLIYSPRFSWGLVFVFFGTFLMSGGAASLNQYQERGLDKLMSRTRGRPIPSDMVSPKQALGFAIAMILLASIVFALVGFYYALVLGLSNVVVYNLIYTNLKTKTQFAVLPGALVGAIPPMMGWTAVGGPLIDMRLFYFALFMFLWQMPHFWLLMAKNAKDYQAAGFKVMSNHLDSSKIKRLVFFWAAVSGIYLMAMPVFFENTPLGIVSAIILLNILFVFSFHHAIFQVKNSSFNNSKAFLLINSYALVAMFLMVLNSLLSV